MARDDVTRRTVKYARKGRVVVQRPSLQVVPEDSVVHHLQLSTMASQQQRPSSAGSARDIQDLRRAVFGFMIPMMGVMDEADRFACMDWINAANAAQLQRLSTMRAQLETSDVTPRAQILHSTLGMPLPSQQQQHMDI